ncbi:MAG: rhomboid family intramembrane serine protease [Alphaproteobacteria bacterium]|nr:rhomboid family intramembrane serine protease [Alphaproteobacteria bacterium]MBU6471110.1 rhomboid family intramembrane serine protease [Alphaproteobacteria bacterium]MDE2012187.1 rhomboid family intramembrane serine protease [Alphaproteobacteria bacterium]MDE2072200.1 rhomboid family intramembrane serine protease [Alphaproteobacteria bacterium]MDE2351751.1 rhomboid family intramembrane serine protease [Alphaproteobacteria bacterium]
MIPISDDNPARLVPVVTWAIILSCAIVFAWELSLGRGMAPALALLGFTPAALGHALLPPPGYVSVPVWATIFTSMFLHGGFLHIGGNMLYLWIFGNNVEDAMGHLRYLLFYLICGVAAALTLAAINPASPVPMIGASGAISGVLAAYVLLYPRARVTVIVPLGIILYPMKISAIWVVGFWFVLQLLSAALGGQADSGVAWWAHIGGFLAGGLLTPMFKSAQFPLFGEVRRGPWG